MGLDLEVLFLVRPFVYFRTLFVWTGKALVRSAQAHLAWAFAGHLCDKYHNLMSSLKFSTNLFDAG